MVMELNQQMQQLDEEVTIFPPSFAQQRLWFIDRLGVTKSVYNIPAAVRLTGELDVLALENSLQAIVDRHEVFRTGFALAEGEFGPGDRPNRGVHPQPDQPSASPGIQPRSPRATTG